VGTAFGAMTALIFDEELGPLFSVTFLPENGSAS
jgi:hypothetical protein